jgi:hypothetical protein
MAPFLLVLFVELLIFSLKVAVVTGAGMALLWFARRLFFEKN